MSLGTEPLAMTGPYTADQSKSGSHRPLIAIYSGRIIMEREGICLSSPVKVLTMTGPL